MPIKPKPAWTNGWHIRKDVSVGHLVTTVALAIALVSWAARLENKIDLNSRDIAINSKAVGTHISDPIHKEAGIGVESRLTTLEATQLSIQAGTRLNSIENKLSSLETSQNSFTTRLERIENKVDKLLERKPKAFLEDPRQE